MSWSRVAFPTWSRRSVRCGCGDPPGPARSGRPAPAASRRRRPDLPDRGRRVRERGTGAPCARRTARHLDGPGAAPARRGARRGVGAGRRLGAGVGAGSARRPRRPERLRAAPPGAGRGAPALPALAAGPHRPGDRGAGAVDRRAEGDRQGGLRRLPHARPASTASGRRVRAGSTGCWLQPTADGCAGDARRGSGCGCTSTRPVPAPSCRPPGSRTPSTGGRRPTTADVRLRTLPGVGCLDQRRGASARVRRRRRGQLRRLPRGQGRRLGADRAPDRRHRARPTCSSRGGRTAAASGRTSRWPASAPRGADRGCRCPRTTRPPSADAGRGRRASARVRATVAADQHELGELAVQVARLPLVEGELEAVGLVDPEDRPRGSAAMAASMISTLIS